MKEIYIRAPSPSRETLFVHFSSFLKNYLKINKEISDTSVFQENAIPKIIISYSPYSVLLTTTLLNKSTCWGKKCILLNVNTAPNNRNMTLIHFCTHSTCLTLLYSLYNSY